MKPWLDELESQAASRAIASGWVSQGPEVANFEKKFAETVGSQYACAVSSCTAALHLALLGVGVKSGDEVITVSHSFVATANSVRYTGATPVFVDIRPDTFNINPELIAWAITERTTAILCVHQMGMPCDLTEVLKIGKQYNLPVVEDAACAIGSEVKRNGNWEKIGKPHSDVACFSFHPRKILTTGDGGMLTTADSEKDKLFRLLRQHGMSVPDTVRHESREVILESYPITGFNYRMTDIQAAIGAVQLNRLDELITRRRYLAARYNELLQNIDGLQIPDEPSDVRTNWQSYCIRLSDRFEQKIIMQKMLERNIATRRGIMCAHREQPYATQNGTRPDLFESEAAQDHCIILPLFHQMTENEQERVATALKDIISE